MEVTVHFLSGETVATVNVNASDTIGDLKLKLDKILPFVGPSTMKLVFDGVDLQDLSRFDDLNLGEKPRLYLIRSPKSAREMLFESSNNALLMAIQYDSLQDLCEEYLGTLWQDDQGNSRSLRENIEVLNALHAKVLKTAGNSPLTWFRAALTRIALDSFASIVKAPADGEADLRSSPQHIASLLDCITCLGPTALAAVMDPNAEGDELGLKQDPRTEAILKRAVPRLQTDTLELLSKRLPLKSRDDNPLERQIRDAFAVRQKLRKLRPPSILH